MRIKKRALAMLLLTIIVSAASTTSVLAFDFACGSRCNWDYSSCSSNCGLNTTCSNGCISTKNECMAACQVDNRDI